MLTGAIILFLVGAVFGLTVLAQLLKGKPSPKTAVYVHGLLVATGLILVILVVTGANPHGAAGGPTGALLVLVIAALGGLTLFILDQSRKTMPRPLLILHPILAVIGVIMLILFALQTIGTM